MNLDELLGLRDDLVHGKNVQVSDVRQNSYRLSGLIVLSSSEWRLPHLFVGVGVSWIEDAHGYASFFGLGRTMRHK